MSIWPTTGPSVGATRVTVTGIGFVGTELLSCKFGTLSSVDASWISATQLECYSSPHAVANVSLEVSNNNQQFTADGVVFGYQAVATVTSLSNTRGPVRMFLSLLYLMLKH